MGSDIRLAYYGDDFTGSTDVLEALSVAGVPTALFLEPPSPETLARHPDLNVVGVAGLSRTMSPAEMEIHLPPVFEALRRLDPAVVHYKICSTFDSSPTVGSIGCAVDIGLAMFGGRMVPIVVGAPVLGRYCVFGNLYARSGGDSDIYRLDRHPTMSRHPVTPMHEADLRLHLAPQTELPSMLVNVLDLDLPANELDALVAKRSTETQSVLLFDTLTNDHLRTIGRILWARARSAAPLFTVGSSGVEYALVAHWEVENERSQALPAPTAAQVDQLHVVSGSCSPVTARQISRAEEAGFVLLALQVEQLLPREGKGLELLEPTIETALRLLKEGHSVIVHACMGPNDPRLAAARDRAAIDGAPASLNANIGEQLGSLLSRLIDQASLQRVVVTGGDTSGQVAHSLGIESLHFVAPVAPGSPICRAEATGHPIHGREIVFKGGQVGKDDFFISVLRGTA